MLAIVYHWVDIIHPSVETRALLRAGTLITIFFTWALIAAVGIFKYYFANKFRAMVVNMPSYYFGRRHRSQNRIIIIASLIWLDNIGYKISTLSQDWIGGIAVALAAQKSIEISLVRQYFTWRHLSVLVIFAVSITKLGPLRKLDCARQCIRTLDRTVITIPNADFAAMPLENFADREKICFNPTLHLRYGTKTDVNSGMKMYQMARQKVYQLS